MIPSPSHHWLHYHPRSFACAVICTIDAGVVRWLIMLFVFWLFVALISVHISYTIPSYHLVASLTPSSNCAIHHESSIGARINQSINLMSNNTLLSFLAFACLLSFVYWLNYRRHRHQCAAATICCLYLLSMYLTCLLAALWLPPILICGVCVVSVASHGDTISTRFDDGTQEVIRTIAYWSIHDLHTCMILSYHDHMCVR